MNRRLLTEGLLFTLGAGLVVHLLYSWIGFNPTDEGYMLAASRRILDGEIPHRDYITLRPPGTQYLHAHLLLWGGNNLIWFSRLFTWLEIAATSWCWVLISESAWGLTCTRTRLVLGWIGLLGSAAIFPIMPWNTFDALLFISLGCVVAIRSPTRTILPFLLIGMAPLFRQNFVFPIPLLILALGHARSLRSWIALAVPGTVYILCLMGAGAWNDAVMQMTSHKGHLGPVLRAPLNTFPTPSLQGIMIGLSVGVLFRFRAAIAKKTACLLLGIALIYASFTLPLNTTDISPPWFLFMILLFAFLFLEKGRAFILPALIVGWGSAISEGCPQPALIGGALFIGVARILHNGDRLLYRAFILLTVVMISYGFHRGRVRLPYWDKPAGELHHHLGEVMPGAAHIYTNENTYRLMKELHEITSSIKGRYAVVPEMAQFWVMSPQRNPLSSDWPIDAEIAGLEPRILSDLERAFGSTTFVVAKYKTELISGDKKAQSNRIVIDAVKARLRKTAETEFFEIYE